MLTKLAQSGLAITLAVAAATAAPSPPNKKTEAKLNITDKPLTVHIKVSKKVRASLAAIANQSAKLSIRLALEGVTPPHRRNAIEGIRVYLNKPDATQHTSTDDPHFVAAFTFTPTDGGKPENVNLDLTRSLSNLKRDGKLDLDKPLRITLVAAPIKGTEALPKGFSVSVAKVSVSAVDLSK